MPQTKVNLSDKWVLLTRHDNHGVERACVFSLFDERGAARRNKSQENMVADGQRETKGALPRHCGGLSLDSVSPDRSRRNGPAQVEHRGLYLICAEQGLDYRSPVGDKPCGKFAVTVITEQLRQVNTVRRPRGTRR